LNVAAGDNIGLYLPQEKLWLDDNSPLSSYPQLQDAEEIEFKDKNDLSSSAKLGGGDHNDPCCVLQ
jgi:hypothetical protein